MPNSIRRPRLAPIALVGLLVFNLCLAGIPALALQDKPAQPAASDKPAAADAQPDVVDQAIAQLNEADNGITVNREGQYVDVKAKVCLRSAEFLEMFACTPDTREHESILVLKAQPSMMHLGLLLLGQEPGKPLFYDQKFSPPKLVTATGPKIKVYIVQKVLGEEQELPANRWVKDNNNGEMMADNTWLFAGSITTKVNDKQVYLADLNGSAISLVNFGDDLLTLPTQVTHANESHGKTWAPRTEAIPRVGTEVTLRLRVVAPDPPQAEAKAKDDPQPDVE